MSRSKQVHLGTILQSVGHTVAWRHMEHASFTTFDSFVRLAQTAEQGAPPEEKPIEPPQEGNEPS